MTLAEFDAEMDHADTARRRGKFLLLRADGLEEAACRRAGIVHVERDPGFPCWTAEGLAGYYDTPRQVVEAMEKVKVTNADCS